MRSSARSILAFCLHQVIATCGVAFFAYFLGASFVEMLAPYGRPQSMRGLHWILTETPYFPIQIALGLYFGRMIGRRFDPRPMRYVWIVPLLVLSYAVIRLPTLTPSFTSVIVQVDGPRSAFSHYFGTGCAPKDRCFDQVLVTMPFYVSVAYSLGSLLAGIGKGVRDGNRHRANG